MLQGLNILSIYCRNQPMRRSQTQHCSAEISACSKPRKNRSDYILESQTCPWIMGYSNGYHRIFFISPFIHGILYGLLSSQWLLRIFQLLQSGRRAFVQWRWAARYKWVSPGWVLESFICVQWTSVCVCIMCIVYVSTYTYLIIFVSMYTYKYYIYIYIHID